MLPVSLAAEGSAQIGGIVSTNAGGTAVLRYGNTRELCLGLEVVTPQGEVWSNLTGLRKDNTGYDLRDLFIGSEGTLGIITAATMKLVPLHQSKESPVIGTLKAIVDEATRHGVKVAAHAHGNAVVGAAGFSVWGACGDFLLVGIGGVALGLAGAWLAVLKLLVTGLPFWV